MAGLEFRGALVGALLMLAGSAWADEPVLPSPRPLRTEVVVPLSFVRPDPMAVWQNYDVDRRGRFRPLVAPIYGEFRYVATGEPYPWWQSHPTWMKPVMGNAATFDQLPPLVIVLPPPQGSDQMSYAK
jgi:hypothetical protein